MKKRMYLFIALFAGASGLYAQDCAKGYCPSTITVHHKAGDVSPVGGDITYGVATIGTGTSAFCIITRNLGATADPTSTSSNGTAVDGWVWQVNRKQGFVFGTWTNAVPSTSITVAANQTWDPATDPCTILLGTAWHIPTLNQIGSGAATWPYGGIKLNTSQTAYMNGASPTLWQAGGAYGYYHIQDFGRNGAGTTTVYVPNTAGNAYSSNPTQAVIVSVRCAKLVSE